MTIGIIKWIGVIRDRTDQTLAEPKILLVPTAREEIPYLVGELEHLGILCVLQMADTPRVLQVESELIKTPDHPATVLVLLEE